MSKRQATISDEKAAYEEEMNKLLTEYKRVLFCSVENVRSQQIHQVRHDLRGKGVLLMGKKTLQRKIVNKRSEEENASQADKQFATSCERLKLLSGMSGLLFTNREISEVIEVLNKHRVQAPARVGAVAPCDVIIPAGNTGMEPTQTSFFQALNIATKISKGTVEIVADKKVLSKGDKVDNSTAALLQKLKISPFYYCMEVQCAWDNGVVFSREDLEITDEFLEGAVIEGLANLNTLAAGAGIPTQSSFRSAIAEGFKNLLAASIGSSYVFTEYGAEKTRNDALSGKLAASAAPAAPAAAAKGAAAAAPAAAPAKAKEAEKPKEEEEEDDFGMGGLF